MAGLVYDVAVIGAGIEGSATAYQLAQEGRQVLLLEQFPLPHSRGSSHGQSRIIRKAYTQEYYARMMPEAYSKWQELEKQSGLTLFKQCGLLLVGQRSCAGVEDTICSLQALGCEHQRLDGREVCHRFPGLNFPKDCSAVYEPGAGILKADLALKAYQSQFVAYGGELIDGCPVLGVRPGDVVYITTASTTYQARRVVITAGPWTDRLIKPLGLHPPLQPIVVSVKYWREKCQGYGLKEGFPNVILDYGDYHTYSLPSDEYPGHMKLCLHTGPNIDPDRRDESQDNNDQELLKAVVRKHYPGLEDIPSIVEKCIYTMTPDQNFILDTHPKWKNIVVGAGFSGHGFKLAPVVGKILSELATGRSPSYNLTPFRLDRFLKTPSQSKL